MGHNLFSYCKKVPVYDYNVTTYIRNPGNFAKFSAGAVKAMGVLSVASLGVAVTNNFVNYEHPWDRTAVDVGCFGAGILAGVGVGALVATAPVSIPVIVVAGAGLLISGGIAWINNKIKGNEYLSERKRE